MNNYEMINIIDVAWEDGNLARAEEMLSEEIVKAGGEVIDMGTMGRRKLAYTINDQTEGNYILSHFLLPPDKVTPLRDSLKLNHPVIRSLIVRHKNRPEIPVETESVEEAGIEFTQEEIPEISSGEITENTIDDEVIFSREEKPESLDDLKVNFEPLPDDDFSGKEKKEV